jgi:hypothetical protein
LDGAEPVEVWCWRAGKVQLAVRRAAYAWLDPTGEELMAEELVAEVGPLSRGARLSLFGAQGYLEGFRVDDASESCCNRVAQCWMDVVERGAARIGAR